MNASDGIALAGAAVVTAAFVLGRISEVLFVGFSLAAILGASVACTANASPFWQTAAVAASLGLYFVGLGGVRVMLHRSLSLRMLEWYGSSAAESRSHAEIAQRLNDAERFHLVRREGETYRLTPLGRAVSWLVTALDRLVRIPT